MFFADASKLFSFFFSEKNDEDTILADFLKRLATAWDGCTAAQQLSCRADWALLLQLCSFAPVRERPREAEESVRSSSLPPFLSLLLFPWRGFSGPRPSLPFFPFFFSFCPFLSSYFLQNVLKSKISVNLYSFVWKRANALPSASRPVAKFLSFPSFSRKSLEIF